jgi:hypothetical protein
MVDFTEFKVGSKIKFRLSENKKHEYVVLVVDEIEWNLHRHPFLVDLKIESSTDEGKWPLNTIILLNIKLEEDKEFEFLLKCPDDKHPNKEIICSAAFRLEKIIMN